MDRERSKRLTRTAALAFGVMVIGSMLFGSPPAETTLLAQMAGKYAAPRVGDQAPDFSLKDFGGGNFTLSKLTRDKHVIVWFTNLCEGCQSEIPTVLRLSAEYRKKGVEVVAVSLLGKDRTTVEAVMKENKVSFRFLYDPDGAATRLYSGKYVEGTCPLKNIFVIGKGGKVALTSHLPGIRINELTAQLDALTGGIQR